MNVGSCPECKMRFQVNPGSKPLNCPLCKASLFVEYVPDRREEKSDSPASVPTSPPAAAEALSLDDAQEAPPRRDEKRREEPDEPLEKPKGVPLALIAGGAALLLLLLAGGGVATWLVLRDKPEETTETAQAKEIPPPEEPKTEPKPIETPKPPPPEEVSPQTLVSRAKSGEPKARVEAIGQLARMGQSAKPAVPDLILLLDDADQAVAKSAAGALDKLGPPAAADAACLPKALAGTGRAAKLYALRHYSRTETASAEQWPLLAKCLDDSDPLIRGQALSALEKVGTSCKSAAFAALFARTADSDPSLAARANKFLLTFAPFDGPERRFLVASLRNPSEQLRHLAVTLLAPTAPDESTACEWFEGMLQDKSAEVRAAALPALARWPGAMKRLQSVLIPFTKDTQPAVREAAIRAIGKYGSGPEVKQALLDAARPKATAADRSLAVNFLFEREYIDPKADAPILAELLKMDDAKVRAKAFSKAAALKGEAKVFLPQIGDGIKQSDADVRLEALKLAAILGADAASLAPAVSEFLLKADSTKPGKDVQLQAVDTLVRFGTAGTALLADALSVPLPDDVFKRVCGSLGGKGAEVPAKLIPQLFVLAEKSDSLRTTMGELIGRIGGDDMAKACAERTFWSQKTVGGRKIKDCKYPLEVQVWAIETMGRMDPKAMSEKGRGVLIERMKSLSKTNPDVECRKAADAAHAKLIAAGLGDKP